MPQVTGLRLGEYRSHRRGIGRRGLFRMGAYVLGRTAYCLFAGRRPHSPVPYMEDQCRGVSCGNRRGSGRERHPVGGEGRRAYRRRNHRDNPGIPRGGAVRRQLRGDVSKLRHSGRRAGQGGSHGKIRRRDIGAHLPGSGARHEDKPYRRGRYIQGILQDP